MLNIGGGELLIIFLVALIVLGPGKLPEAAKQAGQVMREFRRISNGFQRELKQAMNDPVAAATKSATKSSPTVVAAAATPVDVTEDASLPEIEAPASDASWAGDDPETRQARAENIAASTPATPINPDADPFASRVSDPFARTADPTPGEASTPSQEPAPVEDTEGLSGDR